MRSTEDTCARLHANRRDYKPGTAGFQSAPGYERHNLLTHDAWPELELGQRNLPEPPHSHPPTTSLRGILTFSTHLLSQLWALASENGFSANL